MTYRTRTFLFLAAIIVFAALGYFAVMYGQGYKYSFLERRFFRTGAISLAVSDDAKVFIDDNFEGETSFIGASFGQEGLLPGHYVIRLQRDGFSPWQKTVTVMEGQVTDFPHVLIVAIDDEKAAAMASAAIEALSAPEVIVTPTKTPKPAKSLSPSPLSDIGSFLLVNHSLIRITADLKAPETIAKNVIGYTLAPNGQRIAWWTQNELWVMWLRDTNYQPLKKTGDKALIVRLASQIKRAAWYIDNDHLVVDAGGLKIVEIDTRGGVNIIRL